MATTTYAQPRGKPIKIGTVIRHVVLAIFMAIILLPLAWVLLVSIKSIPDAYRPGFWPENALLFLEHLTVQAYAFCAFAFFAERKRQFTQGCQRVWIIGAERALLGVECFPL